MATDVGSGAKETLEDRADVGSGAGGREMGVYGEDMIKVGKADVE